MDPAWDKNLCEHKRANGILLHTFQSIDAYVNRQKDQVSAAMLQYLRNVLNDRAVKAWKLHLKKRQMEVRYASGCCVFHRNKARRVQWLQRQLTARHMPYWIAICKKTRPEASGVTNKEVKRQTQNFIKQEIQTLQHEYVLECRAFYFQLLLEDAFYSQDCVNERDVRHPAKF